MIFLRWRDKTFSVDHEDIIGFCVYGAKGVLPGQERLDLGLMRRDGSLVRLDEWWKYGVTIEGELTR